MIRARECVSVAGGLNGILNVLLATVEPGQEVVICDPIYAGLVNRIRLASGSPAATSAASPMPRAWSTDPGRTRRRHGRKPAAALLMSPAMPTGAVLASEHFDAIAGPVNRHGVWVIYDAAMERIRFDAAARSASWLAPGLSAGSSLSARRPRNCA